MAQLRLNYKQFEERDTEVIVIGPEGARSFQEYWADNQIPFVGLPDPTHSVLKKYGQEINLFKFGRMPAQVLIDRKGIVRYVHYGKSMQDIPGIRTIIRLVDEIDNQLQPVVS